MRPLPEPSHEDSAERAQEVLQVSRLQVRKVPADVGAAAGDGDADGPAKGPGPGRGDDADPPSHRTADRAEREESVAGPDAGEEHGLRLVRLLAMLDERRRHGP